MPIVDGCAGFVSKPMAMGSSGNASTGGDGRACVPVRKGLWPFSSVELMAVEMAACISWLWLLWVCV